jgi:hypothetical protein
MLKIKDKEGKVVHVLKDDESQPDFIEEKEDEEEEDGLSDTADKGER